MLGSQFKALAASAILASVASALPYADVGLVSSQQWQPEDPVSLKPTQAQVPGYYPPASIQPVQTSTLGSFASGAAQPGNVPAQAAGSGYAQGPSAVVPTSSHRHQHASAPYATSTHASHSPMQTVAPHFRGVNLGGWLILEPWMYKDMNYSVMTGMDVEDQYNFDQTPGAEEKLHEHWSSYITKNDFAWMASKGINAVRIPIGYWAYNNKGTPYITGADEYMEVAIEWARQYGIWVMVDLHGSPGSQNGEMHSGRQGQKPYPLSGDIAWSNRDMMGLSIDVLTIMAQKYGSMEYADVVMGIEIVNEPCKESSANDTEAIPGNSPDKTQQFARDAYKAIRSVAANQNLKIITHDAWVGVGGWQDVGSELNTYGRPANFALDLHLYQNQGNDSKSLNVDGQIAAVCGWPTTEFAGNSNLPVFVGEFAGTVDVCRNPDGTTNGGLDCDQLGCQCTNVPMANFIDAKNTVAQDLGADMRRFLEAQLSVFDAHTSGYFAWSLKGPGLWSFENVINYIYQGDTLTTRKYPNICGSAMSGTAQPVNATQPAAGRVGTAYRA